MGAFCHSINSNRQLKQLNTTKIFHFSLLLRYVREKTKTEVDMRVGVHTGTVLGGVLGQKRWQFDVWSTDVTVANKMESGGIPGYVKSFYCYQKHSNSFRVFYGLTVCVLHRRVHISQTTKDSLHGEFELEQGNGGDRCEYLLEKGIETYLVLVPNKKVANGLNGNVSDSQHYYKTVSLFLSVHEVKTLTLQLLESKCCFK